MKGCSIRKAANHWSSMYNDVMPASWFYRTLTNTLHTAPNLCTDTQELAEVPSRNLYHTVVQAGLKCCCSPRNRVPEHQEVGVPDRQKCRVSVSLLSQSLSSVCFQAPPSPDTTLYLSSGRGMPKASLAAT